MNTFSIYQAPGPPPRTPIDPSGQSGTSPDLHLTQVVCHGDEAKAGDVGVVAGFVELLLGRVVAGEALRRFWGGEHTVVGGSGPERNSCTKRPSEWLTNYGWLERTFFKLLLQLCQRRVCYLLLNIKKKILATNWWLNKFPWLLHCRVSWHIQSKKTNDCAPQVWLTSVLLHC